MWVKRIEMMSFKRLKGFKRSNGLKRYPLIMMGHNKVAIKKTMRGQKPSHAWGHFSKVIINNELKAKCNHCRANLVAYNNNETSHLDIHLKRRKAKTVPTVSDSLQKNS